MERRFGEGRENAIDADDAGLERSVCLANLEGALCSAVGVFWLILFKPLGF